MLFRLFIKNSERSQDPQFRLLVYLYSFSFEILDLKGEKEGCALLVLGEEVNTSVELLYDHFADHKAQTNAICVYLLFRVFEGAE
jgi:hypothetical protein